MFNSYKFKIDCWSIGLFLLMMLPNFLWFAFPAPNDVLRITSVTPITDAIGSFLQLSLIATLSCLAFLFYAIDRKNWIATTLGIGFTVCHLIFALVNFIL